MRPRRLPSRESRENRRVRAQSIRVFTRLNSPERRPERVQPGANDRKLSPGIDRHLPDVGAGISARIPDVRLQKTPERTNAGDDGCLEEAGEKKEHRRDDHLSAKDHPPMSQRNGEEHQSPQHRRQDPTTRTREHDTQKNAAPGRISKIGLRWLDPIGGLRESHRVWHLRHHDGSSLPRWRNAKRPGCDWDSEEVSRWRLVDLSEGSRFAAALAVTTASGEASSGNGHSIRSAMTLAMANAAVAAGDGAFRT